MSRPILAAMLSCQTTELTETEKKLFDQSNPLGITLFARNIQNKIQLKNLISQIKEVVGRDDILIAIDQEGGRVRRLKEPDFRSYSAQTDIGMLPIKEAVLATQLHAELISADLLELGINVNFSPVLDICHTQTTEALKSRCFSNDPQIVSILGKTMLETYIKQGIIPCIKHMPGHGRAISDPHLNLPIIDISQTQFAEDLRPFQACKDSPLGMTAHILLPQFDKINPLTQSSVGIKELIRKKIGFKGLLISDAIDMKALNGSTEDKALRAINAGCDAVCYCMADPDEMLSLIASCPKLSDAGTERLDNAIKIMHNKHQITDLASKASQYAELMGKITPYAENYDATEILHQLTKRK